MRRLLNALPGPLPLRLLLMAVLVVAVVLVALFSYEWLGNFLDSGGSIE